MIGKKIQGLNVIIQSSVDIPMMSAQEGVIRLRNEARKLRIHNGQLVYRCCQHKKTIENLREELRKKEREREKLEKAMLYLVPKDHGEGK